MSRCCCNFASPPAKMHSLQMAYPNGVCNFHKVIVNSSVHFFFIIRFLIIRCAVVYSFFNCIIRFFIIRSCCRLFFLQLYHQALSAFTSCSAGLHLYPAAAQQVSMSLRSSLAVIRSYGCAVVCSLFNRIIRCCLLSPVAYQVSSPFRGRSAGLRVHQIIISSHQVVRSCCRLFFLQSYHQALFAFTSRSAGLHLHPAATQQVSVSIRSSLAVIRLCCSLFFLQPHHQALSAFISCSAGLLLHPAAGLYWLPGKSSSLSGVCLHQLLCGILHQLLCGNHQVSPSIVAPSVCLSHLARARMVRKCLFVDSY